jgi:GMP synthase (glutamine-hydrolysing)
MHRGFSIQIIFAILTPIMKRILVLQLRPEDETSDNEYEAFLHRGKMLPEETERIRIEKHGIPQIDFDKYAAILVGGSPFDISTPEEQKTTIQKRIEGDFTELLNEIIDRDFPFLGACSGNGLLGRHCGATISETYSEPVGGTDLTLTEEGMQDPLLAGLPQTFRVLVGHKEACDFTPEGATLLGSSAACPVQMFRVGKNVYATQFHPEADPEVFSVRIEVYKDYGYFPADAAKSLTLAVQNEDTPHAHTFLERFVDKYLREAN